MISDEQRKEIGKEAKSILDNFAKALEIVRVKSKRLKKVAVGYRREGSGQKCDPAFRKAIFTNAPDVEGDCVIAEKKKWQ